MQAVFWVSEQVLLIADGKNNVIIRDLFGQHFNLLQTVANSLQSVDLTDCHGRCKHYLFCLQHTALYLQGLVTRSRMCVVFCTSMLLYTA